MAKHTYTVASEDGAAAYGVEVGETVDLDLTVDQKRAVVAAGWVEHVEEEDTTEKKKKEAKT